MSIALIEHSVNPDGRPAPRLLHTWADGSLRLVERWAGYSVSTDDGVYIERPERMLYIERADGVDAMGWQIWRTVDSISSEQLRELLQSIGYLGLLPARIELVQP